MRTVLDALGYLPGRGAVGVSVFDCPEVGDGVPLAGFGGTRVDFKAMSSSVVIVSA